MPVVVGEPKAETSVAVLLLLMDTAQSEQVAYSFFADLYIAKPSEPVRARRPRSVKFESF